MPTRLIQSLSHSLFARKTRYVNHFERVLGTSLELQIWANRKEQALKAEAAILAEIDRLEAIFSRYNPESELNRWQSGKLDQVSPELFELLQQSQHWQTLSSGAYHPASDALSQLWKQGEAESRVPTKAQLDRVLQPMQAPLWRLEAPNRAQYLSTLPINFNAFAKGYIAGKACAAGKAVLGVEEVLVNLGGDLRHLGAVENRIVIENPYSRADNLPGVATVRLCNQGLATSGRSRRGFQIGERWYSHVLDPRSGYPVETTVSASVIAPDSATADVLATVFSVLEPQASLAMAEGIAGVGCLLITPEGHFASQLWRNRSIT